MKKSIDSKPTNPKDMVGQTKVPLGLIPMTALILEAPGFHEGARKYGQANWRVAGVRASVYIHAALRHLARWCNGEERDPQTHVHHLGSVRACMGIIIDSMVAGKLTDDRPPMVDITPLLESEAKVVQHLNKIFNADSVYQYTIKDTQLTHKLLERQNQKHATINHPLIPTNNSRLRKAPKKAGAVFQPRTSRRRRAKGTKR